MKKYAALFGFLVAAAALLAVPLVSRAGDPAPATPKPTLYERLGGEKAIAAVVDDFLGRITKDARVTANPAVAKRLAAIDVPTLRRLVIEQLSAATGGTQKYTGRDMRSAHAGLHVTEAEWNATVEDLVATLDSFKVPAAEKGELLGLLGPLKADIVQGKSLYERLGGLKAIEAVVDDFLGRISTDKRVTGNAKVAARLAAIDMDALRMHVIAFIGHATGGSCAYAGRDMKSSHAGLDITEAEWNASAEDLGLSLDHFKVPADVKKDLFDAIGTLKADIVQAKK